MGRYYNGDIEGKFWFGLQSSVAADRFGVEHNEPNYVEYCFFEDDLEGVQEEIENILEDLGEKIEIIDKFFEGNSGWNNEMLSDVGINERELGEYADLLLGIQIRDCIKENGQCIFEAEL
jgi:hypothetical protein